MPAKKFIVELDAAFVAAMEDVLDVCTRPHDAAHPLVCLDETSKQLVAETRTPLPMLPNKPARQDYAYKRNGTASLMQQSSVRRATPL